MYVLPLLELESSFYQFSHFNSVFVLLKPQMHFRKSSSQQFPCSLAFLFYDLFLNKLLTHLFSDYQSLFDTNDYSSVYKWLFLVSAGALWL